MFTLDFGLYVKNAAFKVSSENSETHRRYNALGDTTSGSISQQLIALTSPQGPQASENLRASSLKWVLQSVSGRVCLKAANARNRKSSSFNHSRVATVLARGQ
jgi:hypothetical protein